MNPDYVCEKFYKIKPKLNININKDMVVIEGKAKALEFLGKILIAQSKFKKDCSFFISPKGAGYTFFLKESSKGVYIHRTPCLEKKH